MSKKFLMTTILLRGTKEAEAKEMPEYLGISEKECNKGKTMCHVGEYAQHTIRHSLRALCLVCVLAFLMMPSSFAEEKNAAEPAADFTSYTWIEAFDQLHERLSAEYAFTDWKGTDWDTLGAACRAEIQAAQDNKDFEAYYFALRRYVNAIPDGHMSMSSYSEIDQKYVGGGGGGFAPVMLEDGTVIAGWVDEASEAHRAGLRAGDVLLTWNGSPILEAVAQVPTIFASNSATDEDAALKRMAFLARAAVGDNVDLLFQDNVGETHSVILTAYEDSMITTYKTYSFSDVSDRFREMILDVESDEPPLTSMVGFEVLDGNIAYIRIWGELDLDLTGSGVTPSTVAHLQSAVQSANDAGCNGLILDLRNNVGGQDDMTAAILGSFYTEETFYEYQYDYDFAAGTRVIQHAMTDSDALMIIPAENVFTSRIIALINQKCISSGEGLAMCIRNLPNGDILGFYGTNGSFGMTGGEALMPGELAVNWPVGQSLDENMVIQIDIRGGIGGIAPTIRIPMTRERALMVAQGVDVELAEALSILRGE